MKTTKNLAATVLMSILTAVAFTACSDNYLEYEEQLPAQYQGKKNGGIERTVLVYMAGRNNLSVYATADLEEMKKGSKQLADNQVLLVFMRRCHNGEEPWLARIKNGEIIDKVSVKEMGLDKEETYASDPEAMEHVMKYAYGAYPSQGNDYGLVLWGHGGGWLLQDSLKVEDETRGYGVDVGRYIYSTQGKWINMPTMNKILNRMPHLKFIFADCCNFMCLETLYELRHTADYVIGSPAEIPAMGAPYETVVPAMFERDTYYHSIMARYNEQAQGTLPLSVVKCSEMEHVAEATKKVFKSIDTLVEDSYADMTGIIHYNYLGEDSEFHQSYNIFYDAGNLILKYATQPAYQEWKKALDAAVIEKCLAYSWRTEKSWQHFYSDFEMTPEKYHGVSMFVPQDPTVKHGQQYEQFNKDIMKMQWFSAISE